MPFSLESAAHIIQVALTPVFLLSAIAALLNVFSTRLGRVADQVDQLTQQLNGATQQKAARLSARLSYLRRRSLWLDAAVVLAASGGLATCAAAVMLFVGALRDTTFATLLLTAFGLAIVCAMGALGAFTAEMLLAGQGLREEVATGKSDAEEGDTPDAPEPVSEDGLANHGT